MIKTLPISKLRTNNGQIEGLPKNPRFIRDERYEKLKKSIQDLPSMLELRELIVVPQNGHYVTIGGNMRLRAAKDIGLTELPCKVLDTETPVETLAEIAIKDNVGFGQDDFDILANEWTDFPLSDWGMEGLDFEPEEEPQDAEPQIDKAAELNKKWKVKSGDLWQIGEHRLICGDSGEAGTLFKLLGDDKADLCVTSPPYNQNIETFKPSGMQKESPNFVHRMADSYFDSIPEEEYQSKQVEMLELIKTVMADNGSIFYNHKIRYRDKAIVSPFEWLSKLSFPIRQEIIWDRSSSITLNARMFMPADERIYWLRVGDDFIFNDDIDIKSWSSVWTVSAQNEVQISAPFSIEIPMRCIKACSHEGQIVLEPHCGSGTTMVASENLNRQCRAIELNPDYCAVILERMQTAFPDIEIRRKT